MELDLDLEKNLDLDLDPGSQVLRSRSRLGKD